MPALTLVPSRSLLEKGLLVEGFPMDSAGGIPISTCTVSNLNLIVASIAVVLIGTFTFPARFVEASLRLHNAKEPLHNCFSAEGLIIFLAF